MKSMQLPPVLCPAVAMATITATTRAAVAARTPRMSHRSRLVSRRRRSLASAGPPAGIGSLLGIRLFGLAVALAALGFRLPAVGL